MQGLIGCYRPRAVVPTLQSRHFYSTELNDHRIQDRFRRDIGRNVRRHEIWGFHKDRNSLQMIPGCRFLVAYLPLMTDYITISSVVSREKVYIVCFSGCIKKRPAKTTKIVAGSGTIWPI